MCTNYVYNLVLQHDECMHPEPSHWFAVTAVSRIPAEASARELRRHIMTRSAEAHRSANDAQRSTNVLVTTAALSQARAAVLFDRIVAALPSVFATAFVHVFTTQQLRDEIASEGSLPHHDYVLQHVVRRSHIVAWNFITNRAYTLARRVLPARDVRALTRKMRTLCNTTQCDVEMLFEADEMLEETLRRRCGLGRHDSRSWLVDRNAKFKITYV